MISPLFLLIPAAALVFVGVWGLRNSREAAAVPGLSEKTQTQRRRTYLRGSITCLVVAVVFVALTIVSYLK